MRYTLFQYPLPAPQALDELNVFLRQHRVAAVSHHLAQVSGGAMLVFVVETVGEAAGGTAGESQPRVDYRERFNAGEFAVFSRLREQRKRWAEAEGIPVYAVFTNAQLAEMVTRRARSPADLGGIEGVGEARLARYGDRLLELLAELPPAGPAPAGTA